ncbi:MAG TPA: 2-keto-4-pentenoate hydratase [Acidobacteriaceae bacterium]
MIPGPREKELLEAANALVNARRTHTPIADLPTSLQPTSLEEATCIHAFMAEAYGEIGGWKIGAPSADATPFFAPMPRAWMAANAATLYGERFRYRGLEAEIAFQLANDLPPRAQPYTRDEVLAAVASCHPVIEELESGLIDPGAVNRLTMLADLQSHGAFVYGPAYTDWRSLDFTKETVSLVVNGVVQVERTGSNTSGDLLRLLPYLANEGAAITGGLSAGQWITTGSWTGNTPAPPHSAVEARFGHAGSVSLRFA